MKQHGPRLGSGFPGRRLGRAFPVVLVAALTAALAGGTAGAGLFDDATSARHYTAGRPPWYRGTTPAGARVAAIPVAVAPATDGSPEDWLPRAELERLAADATARLAERVAARGGPALLAEALPDAPGPALYLGCEGGAEPPGLCHESTHALTLSITHASSRWRDAVAPRLAAAGADHLLILRLAVADHWLRQKDAKGNKDIPLGTDYAQPVPWLTSLDTPVTVLQLTGMLVDARGKVVRSGVEGLVAVRTGFGESALGFQRTLRAEDVAAVRAGGRWGAALDSLVSGLLGGK